jgi:hypothetical protein
VSLLPAPVMAMGGTHDVGRRVGTVLTVVALGALAGPPISGAINTATGGFKATGYYAGTFYSDLSSVRAFRLLQFLLHRGVRVFVSDNPVDRTTQDPRKTLGQILKSRRS